MRPAAAEPASRGQAWAGGPGAVFGNPDPQRPWLDGAADRCAHHDGLAVDADRDLRYVSVGPDLAGGEDGHAPRRPAVQRRAPRRSPSPRPHRARRCRAVSGDRAPAMSLVWPALLLTSSAHGPVTVIAPARAVSLAPRPGTGLPPRRCPMCPRRPYSRSATPRRPHSLRSPPLALHASASPGALLTRAGRTPRCWRPR